MGQSAGDRLGGDPLHRDHASAVTFFLIQYAALTLPSAKVLAYTYLVPAWVICWEYALGAGLPPVELASGIGLVVVGLVLLLKD